MRRIILIVLDSVGVGELPDAHKYGDVGANTLGNIYSSNTNFRLINLEKMGLAKLLNKIYKDNIFGAYGKMAEKSPGKDTTTGHWEITGIILENAFPVYPNGFPKSIISKFENMIGRKVIGNCTASGTEIIKKYGSEHMITKRPIVYTSADSVFQIAAHEDVVPINELYMMCTVARSILTGEHSVGRVIARPFIGRGGRFERTKNRRDFSLKPIGKTILNYLVDNYYSVHAVGKINDIFCSEGITVSYPTKSNSLCVDKVIELLNKDFEGIIFANLPDFDTLYGHRNNVLGYSEALYKFDRRIPEITCGLKDKDILIITADHGCDPTFPGTDHTREYVPIFVYGKNIKDNTNLGTRDTFADIAKTIEEYFELKTDLHGTSFLNKILS